jgi:predicted DNA-binding transcriptional regulator AlpA
MARVLLTKQQAAERIAVHPEHLMKMARQGKFPKPIRLGDTYRCAVRFDEGEVNAWLDAKLAAREMAPA